MLWNGGSICIVQVCGWFGIWNCRKKPQICAPTAPANQSSTSMQAELTKIGQVLQVLLE